MSTVRFIAMAALLTTHWPGHVSRDPATTMSACEAAGRAWVAGRALPIGETRPALSYACTPMDPIKAGFQRGWDQIKGRR